MATERLGQVAPNWKGAYDSTATYILLDIVYYNGSSFIVISQTPIRGIPPADGNIYALLAQRGLEGETGQNATVTVGTTTTGAPGTNAEVTDTGTEAQAVFNFTIPRGTDGSKWYVGEAITGESTTPTAYPTGIETVYPNDIYMNINTFGSLGNLYQCTVGGNEATALWYYVGNIRGVSGSGNVSTVNSQSPDATGNVDIAGKDIDLTGYAQISEYTAVTPNDTVNEGIGKTETLGLEARQLANVATANSIVTFACTTTDSAVALSNPNSTATNIKFIADADCPTTPTFTVNGAACTAQTQDGKEVSSLWVSGAVVSCFLNGTVLNFKAASGGGGGELGYDIVFSETQPEAKEQRIWIETDVVPSMTTFTAEPPTTFNEGDVNIGICGDPEFKINVFNSESVQQIEMQLGNVTQAESGQLIGKNGFAYLSEWKQFSFDIPDGKTVTPVDNVAIWGACTKADSATPVNLSGMTIEEVVADVEIMKILFNSNNANNYMLRSIEVIQPAVLSSEAAETAMAASQYFYTNPVMTSNTNPEGVVSYSRFLTTETGYGQPYKILGKNANVSFYFAPANTGEVTSNDYIQYQLATPMWIYEVLWTNSSPVTVYTASVKYLLGEEIENEYETEVSAGEKVSVKTSNSSIASAIKIQSKTDGLTMSILYFNGLKIT